MSASLTHEPKPSNFSRQSPSAVVAQPHWGFQAAEDLLKWSWLTALCGSFLSVGLAGFGAGLGPDARLAYFTPGKSDLDSAADSALMADLISESPPTNEVTQESVEEVVEVPPTVDLTQPPLDMPELAEALVTEDLFTIPTAPKIEEALKPIDPTPPKPVVKRVTAAPTSTTPRRSTASSSPGTGTGGGVGSGGTGGGGSGSGKFVIPRPSYPSSLRSMGIQGTVRLKIVVSTSGRPSSVSVIGTSGNSSLDQYAAGWVRRNGKAPPGDVRTVIAPLTFVIN
jgi:TonB family protein